MLGIYVVTQANMVTSSFTHLQKCTTVYCVMVTIINDLSSLTVYSTQFVLFADTVKSREQLKCTGKAFLN